MVGQPDVVDALDRGMGLGEYLSAGPELIDRLEAGSPPAGGVAVVHAAADWYRAGLNRPAPTDFVRRVYQQYLPDDDAALLDQFDQSLRWATTPVSGARMVTHRTDRTGLAVHDYVLDHLNNVLPPGLPATTWTALTDNLHDSPSELTLVGVTAFLTHHDLAVAQNLLRTATDAGNTLAMFNLGVLLEQRDEPVEAEHWWRTAAASGHAGAMTNLGVLLEKRSELIEAEHWWRTAAATGHAGAMTNLGVLLEQRSELVEGERCYRAAAALGHTGAMSNLGAMLLQRGDLAEAERLLRAAAATGNTSAMSNLAVLLHQRGELADAERLLRVAAATGNAGAMFNLGGLMQEQGELIEAEHWWRAAANADHTEAIHNLRVLFGEVGGG
jgi:TPR repeat protein